MMKIICPQHNIEAKLTIGANGVSTQKVEFVYKGEPITLLFDANVTPKTKKYIPGFAKMAINSCIEEKLKMNTMKQAFHREIKK